MDEKLGRTVTRVVLPRVVMHSRYHYAVNYTTFLSPTKQFFLSACCPFHLKKRARINFPPFRLSFVHKMKGQNWQSIYEFLCTGLFWQFYWFRARRWGRTRYIRFCRSPFWLNSFNGYLFSLHSNLHVLWKRRHHKCAVQNMLSNLIWYFPNART